MYLYHFMQIFTLKIQQVLKRIAKDSHTQPIFCFDWIPIVVFDNPEEDDCSNTVDASIQQLYIIHHTKWLSCTAIHCKKNFKCKKNN